MKALTIMLALLVAGCGGGGTPPEPTPEEVAAANALNDSPTANLSCIAKVLGHVAGLSLPLGQCAPPAN